jgi:hypothetical protein
LEAFFKRSYETCGQKNVCHKVRCP